MFATLLLASLSASDAAESPMVLSLWPAGKMPGTGAAAPEMETPAKGDGVVRLTNVSDPTLMVYRAPSATAPTPAVLVYPAYLGEKSQLAPSLTVSAKVPPSIVR
jgi:hypothetical protein